MWPEFPSVAFFSCLANLISLQSKSTNTTGIPHSYSVVLCLLLSLRHRSFSLSTPPILLFFLRFHFCSCLLSSASSSSYSLVSYICRCFLSNYGLPQQSRVDLARQWSLTQRATSASRRTINPHYSLHMCLLKLHTPLSTSVWKSVHYCICGAGLHRGHPTAQYILFMYLFFLPSSESPCLLLEAGCVSSQTHVWLLHKRWPHRKQSYL